MRSAVGQELNKHCLRDFFFARACGAREGALRAQRSAHLRPKSARILLESLKSLKKNRARRQARNFRNFRVSHPSGNFRKQELFLRKTRTFAKVVPGQTSLLRPVKRAASDQHMNTSVHSAYIGLFETIQVYSGREQAHCSQRIHSTITTNKTCRTGKRIHTVHCSHDCSKPCSKRLSADAVGGRVH